MNTFERRMKATVEGHEGIFTSLHQKGGWTTLVGEDGETIKVRNTKWTPLTHEETMALEAEGAVEPETLPVVDPNAEEDDEAARATPILTFKRIDEYVVGDGSVSTPSGRATIDNGDEIAEMLRGTTPEEAAQKLSEVLDFLGEPEEADAILARYSHLNKGMQRMNIGNRLRRAMARVAEAA